MPEHEIYEHTASVPRHPRARRWYQFTLRQFFVAVAIIGCLSGLIGRNAILAHRQRLAVEALLAQNCDVEYGEGWGEYASGWLPQRVIEFLGHDFFSTVRAVDGGPGFCATPAAAIDNLAMFADLPDVEILQLRGYVTDDAVLGMPALDRLADLTINWDGVSDAVMARIGTLGRLRKLNLGWTQITDRGVAELRDLPELEELDVSHTDVTIASLRSLSRLPKLTYLNVSGCGKFAVTQDRLWGSPPLSGDLRQLREFIGSDTPIDDAAVEYLTCMPHLETLDLCRTPITDAAIATIARFRNLRTLRIGNTMMAGKSLGALSRLTNLESLDLGIYGQWRYYQDEPPYAPRLGDEIVPELIKLKQVRTIGLTRLDIGDAAYLQLRAMNCLETLYAGWPACPSDETVAALQQALPRLQIHRDDWYERTGL